MEQSENVVDAMTMTEENPLYVKFLSEKDKFLASQSKLCDKSYISQLEKYASSDSAFDFNAFVYLCYITRKYFKDSTLISFYKLLVAIGAVVAASLFDMFSKPGTLKTIILPLLLIYGIIMIPLCILYIIANLVCVSNYLNYVTTSSSMLSKKIIHFYDPNTDKFQAVNWKSIFKRDKTSYTERKKKRGW